MERPPERGRRVPRAVREQQMLDAAVTAFARHGYRAASMDDIAEAAGVSKPLVYQYLNSKEDLFTACIRREAAALVATVHQATEGRRTAADEQLWNGLCAFFTHTAAYPDGWAVLHQQARTQGEPFARLVAEMRTEMTELVTALIGRAAREAGWNEAVAGREASALAHALVGAAESLATWANTRGPQAPSARETAATLMNLCWPGLQNLRSGSHWAPPGR